MVPSGFHFLALMLNTLSLMGISIHKILRATILWFWYNFKHLKQILIKYVSALLQYCSYKSKKTQTVHWINFQELLLIGTIDLRNSQCSLCCLLRISQVKSPVKYDNSKGMAKTKDSGFLQSPGVFHHSQDFMQIKRNVLHVDVLRY